MKKLFLFALTLIAAQFSQAQWEPDVRLTDNPFTSMNGGHHYIASSGDTIHVVWYDDRDGNNEIYYKRSLDGGLTWEEDIRLTYTVYNSTAATIAVSGLVVNIAWAEDLVGNLEIFYKRSEDGGNSWGDEIQITDTPGLTSGNCFSVSGSLLYLVYYDQSDGWWDVYFKRSTDGGLTWEPEVRLTFEPSLSANTSVCSSGPLVHVVWDEQRDGNREIYYKRSTDNGMTWGFDTRLTNDYAVSWVPCVGASGSDVYIVWYDNRDGNGEIYFKRSTDDGLSWEDDTRLTDNSGDSRFPNLAVSGKSLFVVWVDNSDGNEEIYYKYSTDGGENWEPDIRLTDDPAVSNYPDVSVCGIQVNAIWNDFRDGNYEIYYKRDPTGNFIVGLEDESMVSSGRLISVYPNPASRQLTVGQLDNWTIGELAVKLSIVDLYGREIKEFKDVSLFPYTMDISGLRNGLYFLRVTGEEGKIGTVKFLKMAE
jgi:hypothetical protein